MFVSIFAVLYLVLLCIFFFLPMHVAKDRDLSQHDKSLVKILTWCSIFTGGTTWFIALCLAFFLEGNNKDDTGHKFQQNYF